MSYFLQGFGVFLGVVAGVAVNLIVQYMILKKTELQFKQNLKFEITLNISKIDKWLKEIERYRNSVNADALDNYYGYFDLSRFITNTANEMFRSGLLYKYLNHKAIEQLQVISSEFSFFGENFFNNQINQYKHQATTQEDWWNIKKEVIQNIDFWEKKFENHKEALKNIICVLKTKSS